MPDADYILQPSARFFYERASEFAQRHLDRAFANICGDPFADLDIKFALPPMAETMERQPFAYVDGRFVVIYHLLNAFTVSVLSIADVGSVLDDEDIPP